jgi:polar amino acid transport system substrate-binding protein
MWSATARLVAALAIALGLAGSALAQTTPSPGTTPQNVRVVTRVLPPMVVERDGALTGFSIDLWREIAERLNLKPTYHVAPNIGALLADVKSGKAQIGVAAISVTAAREEQFDFSQPFMNAGLQIMVSGQGKDDSALGVLGDLLGLLFSTTSLVWIGIATLLILIPAHLVWYLERRHPSGIIPTTSYIPGIFHALYWSAATLATQSDVVPRQWIARLFAILWMFVGIVFVALYTAQLTATLTVQQIRGGINGPDDLAGKRVATTRGSTGATALRSLRADVVEVERIDEAYAALLRRDVEAVVFDSPVLLYYAANAGKGRVQLVGAPFRKEDYGMLLPQGSPLRNRINVMLLTLREDGTYQRLYDKWFGTPTPAKP